MVGEKSMQEVVIKSQAIGVLSDAQAFSCTSVACQDHMGVGGLWRTHRYDGIA